MNTRFTNANILTPQGVVRGCLGVADDRIAFVGELPQDFLVERSIDCEGGLLLPGLVNAHTHLSMTLFRNAADDMELSAWLQDRIWPLEDQLDAEACYYGALLALAEGIRGGTTAFNDMYFFEESVARAVAESGVRAVIARSVVTGADGGKSRVEEARQLYLDYNGAEDDRIHVAIAPHAEYTCSEETLIACEKLAHSLGASIHIHLSETYQEHEECKLRHQLTPAAYLASLGMLGEETLLAHCVHCDADDAALLGAAKATVLHCPQSNLKLGSGIAPVMPLLAHGVNIALGTDGAASNNNLDMFEELRLAATLHKGVTMNPKAVNAKTALQMATENGARALGWQSGRLQEGYLADVVLVDTNIPSMQPVNDLTAAAAYSASAGDVLLTMANGRILYERGEYYTLDIERILANAARIKDRLGL